MKYYFFAAAAVLAGVVAVVVANRGPGPAAENDKNEWKRYAVETETKVRPAYFEDMKYKPEAVELRAPASKDKN